MSTTYVMGNTNSDLTVGINNKYFETSTGTPVGITVSLGKSGSQTDFFFTRSGVPNLSGAAAADGTYSFSINLTTANANVVATVAVAHFNSSGTNLDGSQFLVSSQSWAATGVKTGSASVTFATSWSTTDRLAMFIQMANASSMSTASITYEVLGSFDFLTAPFGGASPTSLIYDLRRSRHSMLLVR